MATVHERSTSAKEPNTKSQFQYWFADPNLRRCLSRVSLDIDSSHSPLLDAQSAGCPACLIRSAAHACFPDGVSEATSFRNILIKPTSKYGFLDIAARE